MTHRKQASYDTLCKQHLIHAYVDGELDSVAESLFHAHLEECENCRAQLRAHQKFVCELDAVFTEEVEIVMPVEFSRLVAARAVSDMSGVRSVSENKKALAFALILGVTGFALLGATARQLTVGIAKRLFAKVFGVLELVWNALYDSISSVAVISRVLGRKFIVETGNVTIVLVLFALAVVLLSRLISDYHRTGTVD